MLKDFLFYTIVPLLVFTLLAAYTANTITSGALSKGFDTVQAEYVEAGVIKDSGFKTPDGKVIYEYVTCPE